MQPRAGATTPGDADLPAGSGAPADPGRAGARSFEIELPRWLSVPFLRRWALPSAALVLVAAQLLWKWSLFTRGYFWGDDFAFVARAAERGFGWDYLTAPWGPKLLPAGFALAWVVTHLDAYGWELASGALLALQAAASLAVYRLLRVLFGARPLILVPLALYLFTPLTLPGLLWWAAGLELVPLQLAICLALTSQVHYVRTRRIRHVVAVAGWFLLGLASFFLKAAVGIPLLLFLLTAAYFTAGPWWRGWWAALRGNLPIWGALAAVLAPAAVVYLSRADTGDQPVRLPPAGDTALFAGRLLGETFPTAAVGGPGTWFGGLVAPSWPVIALAWAVLALYAAATLALRARAARAWAILLAYLVLADLVPVLLGRGVFEAQALEPRYVADAAVVLALCAGLTTLPLPEEPRPYRALPPRGLAVPAVSAVLVCVFLVASYASGDAYAAQFAAQRARARGYVEAAGATLAKTPATADVYPQPLPADVLIYGFGEGNLSSHVLSPLAPEPLRDRMRHPRPAASPLVLAEDGRGLVPPRILGGYAVPERGARCFPRSAGTVTLPVRSNGDYAVGGFTYEADRPTSATVRLGEARAELSLGAGPAGAYFPVKGVGEAMTLTLADRSVKLCVTGVVLGTPVPGTTP
ncbi:hypothetical protein [Microtetraspora niveoalba]|uniref:hypothetical protein n=1 Tax=Microtetraspora niveoalba TaxID=46175 RepID=UPI000ACDF9EA|nr:hypothetical protein [Microtetraspora niveoalba]